MDVFTLLVYFSGFGFLLRFSSETESQVWFSLKGKLRESQI
jgi:hypothetical protein